MTKNWTNIYKRIVIGCAAVLFSVVAIVGGMALLGRAENTNESMSIWDGSRDQFPDGFGTYDEPFLISTGSQLAFIADRINNVAPPPYVNNTSFLGERYFELINDIVLSSWPAEIPSASNIWTPIGNNNSDSASTRFGGHFDGKGHRISGLYINSTVDDYCALFGYSTGTIKNIKLENSRINGRNYTAGIVGYSSGAVENCYSEAVVQSSEASNGTAGTAGSPSGSGGTSGGPGGAGVTSYTGGIAAYSSGEISNCTNVGGITGGTGGNGGNGGAGGMGIASTGGSGGYGGSGGGSFTGGIAGYGNSVSNCTNVGSVIGKNGGKAGNGGNGGDTTSSAYGGLGGGGGTGGGSYTGGITGSGIGAHENNSNYGNVTGAVSGTGGLGGNTGSSNGTVYAGRGGGSGGSGGSSYTGGVVGYGTSFMYNSNKGTVSGSNGGNGSMASSVGTSGNGGSGGSSYTGGIAGRGSSFLNDFSSGNVTGGIGGNGANGRNVNNCTSGNGGGSYTGGITGNATSTVFCYVRGASITGGDGGNGGSGDSASRASGSGGVSYTGGITGFVNYVFDSLFIGGDIKGGNAGAAGTVGINGIGANSDTGGIAGYAALGLYNCQSSCSVVGGNGGKGGTEANTGKSQTGGIMGTGTTVYNSLAIGSVSGGVGGGNNPYLSYTGSISGGTGRAENCYYAGTSRINVFEPARATSEQLPENAVDCFSFNADYEVKLSGGERVILKELLNGWVGNPTVEIPNNAELSSWMGEGVPYLSWIDEEWGDPFLVFFTITFNSHGGSYVTPLRVHSNSNLIAMRPANPTLYGHDFAGWYKDELLTEPFDFGTELVPEWDITLHAQWTPKHYTIVYDFNGGSHSIKRGTATFGEKLNLVVPTQELYRFDGWFSMDGGIQYTDSAGKSSVVWSVDPDGEINMIAHWTKIAFRISFATNTAEDVISARVVDENSNMINERPRTPVRKGYDFDGWYKEPDLKNIFNFSVESPPTEDITLYAGWTAKTYTVVYHFNGGTHAKTTDTVKWGETYTLVIPKLDNYYFQGWFGFDGRQFTNTIGKSDTFTWDVDVNNFDLYARWETAKYDMRFDFNDGRPWITITHQYNEKIPANMIPADPTRDFGIFQGWYTPEGVKFDFEEMTMPANGTSLTARWAVDMTKLQILVSELQGYIDFDGFDAVPYKTFLDALGDSTTVVNSLEPQTIERVKQSHDDLLTAAIALTIADFTGKVTPPNEFRPPNAGNTWVFILLGVILLITALALTAWFVMRKRKVFNDRLN